MIRKMLFVRPPAWEMSETAKNQNIIHGTVPYGVLSIMSYVNKYKKSDIDLNILDLNVYPWTSYNQQELFDNFKEYIENHNYDIVGISIMYNHMYSYIESISRIIKGVNTNAVTIVGGACATVYYDKILDECESIDAVCYSEGELPVLDLLESEDILEVLRVHQAFITKKEILNKKIPVPMYIYDLDEIPAIDFDLIDLSLYLNKFSIMRPKEVKDEFCLPITTTRGCPYSCIFCTSNTLSGKTIRKASAEKVLSDIKQMKDKYNVNTISIDDDQFLYDRNRAIDILKGLINLKLNLFVASGFTISLIDDEIIGLMKKAGLQMITLPIESGSPYIAHKVIHKPIKLDKVSEVVSKLRKNGIYCHGNIIIGFPTEKEEHRQESIDFIKQSGIDWCYIFCATALKGSKLYDICIENNYIDSEISKDGYFASHIETPDFSSKEITDKSYLMNLELNFVCNNNMKRQEYDTAIIYFKHIVSKYKDHAFAHYYLAKCYEAIEDTNNYTNHLNEFNKIILDSEIWKQYSKQFGLI